MKFKFKKLPKTLYINQHSFLLGKNILTFSVVQNKQNTYIPE